MGKVITHMTMSLDGFVADTDDRPQELFDWYTTGKANLPNPSDDVTFNVDQESATALRELTTGSGALVAGRRLFDIAGGWNDAHPSGSPVVVVTRRRPDEAERRWPTTTFVDGVEPAIARARAIAGDKNVTIASAEISQQALDLELVDEICVSLVPVLFGDGIRYFGPLERGHLLLEDPVVTPGHRALHLRYRVTRAARLGRERVSGCSCSGHSFTRSDLTC